MSGETIKFCVEAICFTVVIIAILRFLGSLGR